MDDYEKIFLVDYAPHGQPPHGIKGKIFCFRVKYVILRKKIIVRNYGFFTYNRCCEVEFEQFS